MTAPVAHRFVGSADAAFFRERETGRKAGTQRSLLRAKALADALGIRAEATRIPVIAVVGSKGKGTAAVYASATLCAAGLRTGTLTSPGLRSNRERIRVDGDAISESAYENVVQRVVAAVSRQGHLLPQDGYISPTGFFTLAAVLHFIDAGCDAMVLEAGMGGAHDEISLFPATVAVVTPIFAEHLGILGDSVAQIAAQKLGIVVADTRAVVTGDQSREVDALINGLTSPRLTRATSAPLDARWPVQPIAMNAWLGVAGGWALLEETGRSVDSASVRRVLNSVRTPGRLSLHSRGQQRWLVDTATNAHAAKLALRHASATFADSFRTLACVPDGKDIDGVRSALVNREVTWVRTEAPHLSFSATGDPPALRDVDIDALGGAVLALGTVHFVGDVLEYLGVDAARAFSAL